MNRKQLEKSFGYALRGIRLVFTSEQNFRIQLFFGFVAVLLGFIFRISASEFLFLFSVIVLILILECINTAIEHLSDVVKPRLSEQVKMVKDIMAGAVLLASILSVILGICIFWPYITNLQVENFLFF